MTISIETVVIGALSGLSYAVLGAGLVLVYRATRVINFAHGEIGAFGAAILAKLVIDYHWNWFATLALVLVIGAIVGGLVELTVIRRLFRAPRLVLLVATIGVAQLLFVSQLAIPGTERIARYPSPLRRVLEIGDLLLRSEHFMVIALVPACIVGLALFLMRTPYGVAIRAAAENPDAAELAGISAKRVSTMVWVIAGVLSTLTAVLINPLRGTVVGLPSLALGPGLLLRALAAALVGRLFSLPWTLAGGVAVGVIEAVLFVNTGNPGSADALLFVAVLGLVFLRGRSGADEETGAWSLTPIAKPVSERLRQLTVVRRFPLIAGAVIVVGAVVLPLVFTAGSQIFLFSRVVLFAMVALSVTVLTGWAGQLSLGQVAFVGLGSMITASLVARGMPFGVAVCYAVVGGVIASVLVGFPALRLRGLYLAITTLAFAVAARGWILSREIFIPEGSSIAFIPRGSIFGVDLKSERAYYYLCLIVLVGAVFVTSRLRRSGPGRVMIAVRDNENAAASVGLSPAVAKLSAFAVAGGLASLAGALLGGLRVQFGPDIFGPEESLRAVAMAIIGGLGTVTGAILGSVYVVGLPAAFGSGPTVSLLTSGIGLLILLLYLPGGLVQLLYGARDAILGWLDRRSDAQPPSALPKVAVVDRLSRNGDRPEVPDDVAPLRVENLTVRFGGLVAVDDVSLEVRQGEVVGLIGSNGAGKSTLMNAISGFVRPADGRIEVFGADVTDWPSHLRSRVGVGRVFQDARLFSDLTVRECVQVALEANERSELVPSMLGVPPSLELESRRKAEAAEFISFLGLGRYEDALISELSTGTRRIVELASLLAQDARLLLLDEPTAGVAQKEAEAFGPLIRRIQQELDATVLIIEHDMPLIMSISDRVYAMSAGRQIAEGTPEHVRKNPAVVAAYLGTDERAIARSGVAAVVGGRPRKPSAAGGRTRK